MKNKLLKALTCFAGIFAIGSTIAITSTSCNSQDQQDDYWPEDALPREIYDIDEATNVLKGFKQGIDLNQYKDTCDTMLIPASVTSIDDNAFFNTCAMTTIIPDFIKNLTFAKESNCSSIGDGAFSRCSSLTSITFPSSLTTIGDTAFSSCSSLPSVTFPSSLTSIGNSAFWSCNKLNYIAWDLPEEYKTDIEVDNAAFSRISSTGTVESLNLSIASSQQLFDWIKTKGSFPQTGWRPAD